MRLFSKKKEEPKNCCREGNRNLMPPKQTDAADHGGAAVKILGSGCAKCSQLEAAVKEALNELNLDTTMEHVTDFSQIAAYGVMSTPALVVDGKVISYGKVLKKDEAAALIKKARGLL